MLPAKLRAALFERMSVMTMRYLRSIPRRDASGLVARVYDMVADEFFINGSITSQSKVPELMAAMWTCGREIVLVSDRLDRATKEAMSATLSQVNDCAYCSDMLISLVHGSGRHEVAARIFARAEQDIADDAMRARLAWVKAAAGSGATPSPAPFTPDQRPEAIGCLLLFGYINRFSHVVMDGSPVTAPFGLQSVKGVGLRLFGTELKQTTERRLEPGRALGLLAPAPLPDDLCWAAPNPRIAEAVARWAAAIDRETPRAVAPAARARVERSLARWRGERMPLSRGWVDDEVAGLAGRDREIARFALVVAKASYQVDDALVAGVLGPERDEARLIRVLAWASFTGARRLVARVAAGGETSAIAGEHAA